MIYSLWITTRLWKTRGVTFSALLKIDGHLLNENVLLNWKASYSTTEYFYPHVQHRQNQKSEGILELL